MSMQLCRVVITVLLEYTPINQRLPVIGISTDILRGVVRYLAVVGVGNLVERASFNHSDRLIRIGLGETGGDHGSRQASPNDHIVKGRVLARQAKARSSEPSRPRELRSMWRLSERVGISQEPEARQ